MKNICVISYNLLAMKNVSPCFVLTEELSPLKEELASYHKYLSTPHGLITLQSR